MGLDATISPQWAKRGPWFPLDKVVTKRSVCHLVAAWKEATNHPEKRGSQAAVVQGACTDIRGRNWTWGRKEVSAAQPCPAARLSPASWGHFPFQQGLAREHAVRRQQPFSDSDFSLH